LLLFSVNVYVQACMPSDYYYLSLSSIAAKKKQHSPSPDYSVESDFSEDQEDAEDYRHGKGFFFQT
jgi:hypothetical protein